jgi:hypothetical protein
VSLVFFMNHLPPTPENNIRVILSFLKICGDNLKVKVYHWYQQHRQQILPPVLLVLLFTIQVANNGNNIRLQALQGELEGKNLHIYVNSSTQRCPYKIMTIFLIADFFHLPPVSTTPAVHIEL